MNKRAGFKPFYLQHSQRIRENFDTVYGTSPNKLYMLTDESGMYAITGDDSEYIALKPKDKNNKYQWLLVDADSGVICFFIDLRNYMQIDVVEGVVHVKRGDILQNGSFTFNKDKTLSIREGYTNYCLAFKKSDVSGSNGSNGGSDGGMNEGPTDAPTEGDTEAPTESQGVTSVVESFIRSVRRTLTLREPFNPDVDILLEVVDKNNPNISKYSTKWNFELVQDLRELTDNIEVIKTLQEANESEEQRSETLQNLIDTNKMKYDTQISLKDSKISLYESIIQKYEDNWFVRWFLKKSVNPGQ